MNRQRFIATALLPLLVACDGSTGPEETLPVSVKFATSTSQAAIFQAGAVDTDATAGAATLVVDGTNGTLTLTDIRFIVSELEIERLESECENSGSGNLCRDFEAPPTFVQLPLDGGAVAVATADVPEGSYDELDFEVEDLEVDADDDSAKAQQIQNLFTQIRSAFGDFPSEASMVVAGTFTPSGGDPVPFRVYFDAEIEVELRFDPALEIDADGAASQAVVVDVQPSVWFKTSDGTVMDLSEYDYETTNELVEFELEMEKGFAKLEIETDD